MIYETQSFDCGDHKLKEPFALLTQQYHPFVRLTVLALSEREFAPPPTSNSPRVVASVPGNPSDAKLYNAQDVFVLVVYKAAGLVAK